MGCSAAIALEVLSETGFVVAWRAIVDPQKLLDRDGRGRRTDDDVAWAQLGGGLLFPGGAWGGVGSRSAGSCTGSGVPTKQIAEREFNLSFLNTADRRAGADRLRCRARDRRLARRGAISC